MIDDQINFESLGDSPAPKEYGIVAEEGEVQREAYTLQYAHSVQGLAPNNNTISIRLKAVSQQDKEIVATALANTLMDINPKGVGAQSGDCPVFRGQWDFVLFRVPDVKVNPLREILIKAMLESLNG